MRRYLPLSLELAAITLTGLLFVTLWVSPTPSNPSTALDTRQLNAVLFNPIYRNTALEHERLSGVLYPVKIGLERYRHLPTWNPYIGTGEPIINNAFSYLFNPLHSLPVLLSDSYIQGTKLATVIALLVAGYSMWTLTWAVGVGAVGRVMAGVIYMTCGSIAGKFYGGHFQLALSLAWPPLVMAAMWWTLNTRHRTAPVGFGIAFALLFFAGNIYYALHTLVGCGVIVLAHLIYPKTDTQRGWLLRRGGVALAFAFGLSALQFFPVWLTRDYVIHDNQIINDDGTLEGHYNLGTAFNNFVTPWSTWNTHADGNLNPYVDYAYIGQMTFVFAALGVIVAVVKRFLSKRTHEVSGINRAVMCGLILAALMTLWGTGEGWLIEFLYRHIPLLAEFRYVGRALAIAGLWWILLAAIGIDSLWKMVSSMLVNNRTRLARVMLLALVAWGYFLVYSAAITSTRLGLVGYNYYLLNSLDARRFTRFESALAALWVFLLIGVAADTAFMVIWRLWKARAEYAKTLKMAGARLLQAALLGGALLAMHDTMATNSALYQLNLATSDFSAIYTTIHEQDAENPIPSVNVPFAPEAYAAYEHKIRNWGLDEGWRPGTPAGLITWKAGSLPDMPRWAIASRAYGDVSLALAQNFIEANGYEQRACFFISPRPDSDDACNLNALTTAVLYEKPDALPYAYAAPADILTTNPASLSRETIFPAEVVSHEQDTISIRATTPDEGRYYLIVQESHFPGWSAMVDGEAISTFTAETYHDLKGNRGVIAIPMKPGEHVYRLWFEPPGFGLGIGVSLLTVMGIGVYLAWRRR